MTEACPLYDRLLADKREDRSDVLSTPLQSLRCGFSRPSRHLLVQCSGITSQQGFSDSVKQIFGFWILQVELLLRRRHLSLTLTIVSDLISTTGNIPLCSNTFARVVLTVKEFFVWRRITRRLFLPLKLFGWRRIIFDFCRSCYCHWSTTHRRRRRSLSLPLLQNLYHLIHYLP